MLTRARRLGLIKRRRTDDGRHPSVCIMFGTVAIENDGLPFRASGLVGLYPVYTRKHTWSINEAHMKQT